MPIGIGQALWAAVLPKETTNLITNPSIEFGTAGWAPLGGGASIGSTSYTQAFGAWSLQVNHTVTSEGAFLSYGTPAVGSYMMTAFFKGTAGHRYRILSETATGGVLGAGSVTATGGWDTVTAGAGVAAGTGLLIVVRHVDSADGTFYVDGVQLESGTFPTTYTDGDQAGGTWLGAPHASPSFRSGQYRGGGSIVALADIGLSVDQFPGAGVMPIENSAQSYAVTDGAQFQRQRAASRTFTLTAKPIVGTSLADFHVTRRTLWDVFKPDLVTPQQPISFLYYGGQGTIGIQAYYAKGLELGNMDGPIAENAAISFAAYDPYWYFPTQQGTTLAPRVNLGSTNFLAWRDPRGKWGTLGSNGTTVHAPFTGTAAVYAVENINGTVVFGGYFGSVAGVGVNGIGRFANGALGSLAGGGVGANQAVLALVVDPAGTLYAGGDGVAYGGTSTNYIGRWANAWGTLIGGTMTHTANQGIYSLAINQTGTLFIGGTFNGAAGSTSRNLVRWFNNAYGTLNGQNGGTIDGIVQALTIGMNNTLYYGGEFGSGGGTATDNIGQWFGSFGTMTSGVDQKVNGLATMLDGRIVATGNLLNAGGGSAKRITFWNGVQFFPAGDGITSGVPVTAFVRNDNSLLISGRIQQVGSVPTPAGAVVWNGYAFLPFDIDINVPGGGVGIWDFTQTPDGTVWAGGDFLGTATAASVAPIINSGRSIVYPNVRLRNLSSGTARVYQIVNPTTGAGIYFNLSLLAGERADLVLMPGKRSFTSTFRGNILNSIIPGSNLATFNLLSGTNYISFFSDNSSLEASFFWQPRGASIDGGTIL